MKELIEMIRRFADERDWEQFHSPKNLSMALTVEAGELMEHMQWLTEEESRKLPNEKKLQVADEIGDVLVYLVRLSDQLGIDPMEAAFSKMEKNALKYPADKSRGNALKYKDFN